MSTSLTMETINYGFHIKPQNYCRVQLQQKEELFLSQLKEELFLSPKVDYYLPWNKEEIIIIEEKPPNVTGRYEDTQPPLFQDPERMGWLKLAESAFKFWDNEADNIWDEL